MPRPILVGINCDSFSDPQTAIIGLREPLVQAVARAGAIPVLIPFLEDARQVAAVLDRVDAVVMSGGDDLCASRIGVDLLPGVVPVRPERDRSDFLLIDALLGRRLPTLAICLGFQELNVALGGTIYQDLPVDGPAGAMAHKQPGPDPFVRHALRVADGCPLAQWWNGATETDVNSSHHQAVCDVATELEPIAWAPDGIVEAAVVRGHPFFLGVQWHPERMANDERQRAIFDALITTARERSKED